MNLIFKKIKLLSLVLVMIATSAIALCYGLPAKASMSIENHHNNSLRDYGETKSDGSMLCCVNKPDYVSGEYSNFSTPTNEKSKIISSAISTKNTAFLTIFSKQRSNELSSSPSVGERLSSVVKKE